MTDRTTEFPSVFRPATPTGALRPALLLAGVQVVVALLSSVLLTSGLLA